MPQICSAALTFSYFLDILPVKECEKIMATEYIKRICDDELALKLEAFGAVHIVGPKWCGKTTTAKQFAKSYIYDFL